MGYLKKLIEKGCSIKNSEILTFGNYKLYFIDNNYYFYRIKDEDILICVVNIKNKVLDISTLSGGVFDNYSPNHIKQSEIDQIVNTICYRNDIETISWSFLKNKL